MKKILFIAIVITSFTQNVFAETINPKYQTNSKVEFSNTKITINADENGDTIFTKPEFIPQYEPYTPQIPKIQPHGNQTDMTTADKMVISNKNITKELKNKYSKITKSEKLIEACELLKDSAGDFSYRSIHGQNKTSHPISIEFVNLSRDKNYSNRDAVGTFVGNKYKISINDKFIDAPAAAIAPLLAREALVNKNKTEEDLDDAEQLQVAVWVQLLEKNPFLKNSKNSLVKINNTLLENSNADDYGAFLEPVKQNTAKKNQPNSNFKPNKSKDKMTPPDLPKPERKFGKKEKGAPIQSDFDENEKAKSAKNEEKIMSYNYDELKEKYKQVTTETRIIEALELLQESRAGVFSHNAILGNNPTHKPMQVQFKDLSELNPKYESFDALGWRKGIKGKRSDKLMIFINSKHIDAPAGALAALLSHEALHQDEFDSLNEETYAWTMEAFVWTQMCDKNPNIEEITHPLVTRENILKKLLEKGEFTNKYIKKSVFSNPSYSSLPVRSPGFEDEI